MAASWDVALWDDLPPDLAVLFIFPTMALLHRLARMGLLPDEGVEVGA